MFDTTNLTEVPTYTRKGWTTKYYLDSTGVCQGKTCSSCRETLPVSEFGTNKRGKHGISSKCRECNNSYGKSRGGTIVNGVSVRSARNAAQAHKYRSRSDEQIVRDRDRLRPNGVKLCTSCTVYKPFSEFGETRTAPDGLRTYCKPCMSTRYAPATPEDRARRTETNRRVREKYNSRSSEEILSDRFRLNPTGTKTCPKCGSSHTFDSFYPNRRRPDGLDYQCKPCSRESSKVRRTHRDSWSTRGIPEACYVCDSATHIHSDHVIPSSRGGSDGPSNRLPMCGRHNLSKGDTPLEVWLRSKHPDIADDVIHRVTVTYGVQLTLS